MFLSVEIFIAIIVIMFIAISIYEFTFKYGFFVTSILISLIALISSIYCIYVGIFIFGGWEDRLINAPSGSLLNHHTYGGKSRIFYIVLIKYAPYLLIALGTFFSAAYLKTLKESYKKIK